MNRLKLTPAMLFDAYAEYVTGREKVTTIARRYGIGYPTFLIYLERYNLPRRRRGIAQVVWLTDEQVTAAAELHDEGVSLAEIADRFCVSQPVITRWLKAAGHDTRKRSKASQHSP